MTAQRSVVILGAGVIGLSTAYYISASISPTDPIQVFILDTSPVLFQCASGRAAGFIARDWFSSSLAELGELSFRLHKELADRYDGRRNWGYSGTVALSLNETHNNNDLRSTEGQRGEDWLLEGDTRRITASRTSSPSNHHPEWPQWLKKVDAHLLSTADSTAQVDPRRFCEFLLAKCKESNVTVIYPARAVGVATDVVSGLPVALSYTTPELSEHTIPCTDLLLAAGPWTGRVYEDLFPKSDLKLPISNLAGWSVVYRDPTPPTFSALAPCYSAFTTSASEGFSPEVFSRLSHVTSGEGSNLQDKSQINRDIYLAGLNSADLPLPNVATEVAAPKLDDPQIASLLRVGRRVFSSLSNQLNETTTKEIDSLDILRTNLCHRPVTPSGRPILTRLGPQHYASHVQLTSTATETETASHGTMGGLYICAGHGPWGISLSLGSGKVCADLILGHTNALVYSSELDANLSFPPHTK